MIGTRDISGSDAIRLRNFTMAASLSSIASSIFTSIICAPASTCCLATSSASSYSPFKIRRLNFAEPVTLVLSPTLINMPCRFVILYHLKRFKAAKAHLWLYYWHFSRFDLRYCVCNSLNMIWCRTTTTSDNI